MSSTALHTIPSFAHALPNTAHGYKQSEFYSALDETNRRSIRSGINKFDSLNNYTK